MVAFSLKTFRLFCKKMKLREFVLISFYYGRFLKISKEHMKSAFIAISKGLLAL